MNSNFTQKELFKIYDFICDNNIDYKLIEYIIYKHNHIGICLDDITSIYKKIKKLKNIEYNDDNDDNDDNLLKQSIKYIINTANKYKPTYYNFGEYRTDNNDLYFYDIIDVIKFKKNIHKKYLEFDSVIENIVSDVLLERKIIENNNLKQYISDLKNKINTAELKNDLVSHHVSADVFADVNNNNCTHSEDFLTSMHENN